MRDPLVSLLILALACAGGGVAAAPANGTDPLRRGDGAHALAAPAAEAAAEREWLHARGGSLRRELEAATGSSARLAVHGGDAASASAALPDAIFWDGYELCGNGSIDAGEDCDRSDLGGNTCVTQGYAEGTLSCDRTCHFDTSQCSGTCLISCTQNADCGVCGICFMNVCIF